MVWQILAPKHFDTRFIKINVENAPFLVTKLNVKVLPCVLAFKDGITVDRIIGFEGLGFTQDDFTTKDLETRLLTSGVIQRAKTMAETASKLDRLKRTAIESDDDDWE